MTCSEGRTRARPSVAASGLGPALVAVAACLVCYAAGWRGPDWAAQIYRAHEAARHGLVVWDPGWYGGMLPPGYSLLFPLLAGYLGLWPVAALSSAGAAFCFDRLVAPRGRSTPAISWYFALSTVIEVSIGQLPTLTGEAFALGSFLCLSRFWRPGGARPTKGPGQWLVAGLACGLAAAAVTPLAGLFLSLALGAWAVLALGERRAREGIGKAGAATVVLASSAALPLAFESPGYFAFPVGDLLVVLSICALVASPWLAAPMAARVTAVGYAVMSGGLFLVRTQVGDNDARLAAYLGVPLVIGALPRAMRDLAARLAPAKRRSAEVARKAGLAALTTLVVGSLAVWEWAPAVGALDGPADGVSSAPSFYKPLVAELSALTHGRPVRVEVAPTAYHWESAYVAPSFALAQGWERQLSVAYDALFYERGGLSPASYRAWLVSNGVSYVALPNAPLDYSATAEGRLLRSGAVQGLSPIWRSRTWELWEVLGSPGLSSAPAEVVSMSAGKAVLQFSVGGSSVVKVRWSPYWSLPRRTAGTACLARAPGGWTEVTSLGPQTLSLSVSFVGASHGHCSALLQALAAYHRR